MIANKCFKNDWIAAQRVLMPNATAVTIEKSIRAFALLEHLAASGLRFVFKELLIKVTSGSRQPAG